MLSEKPKENHELIINILENHTKNNIDNIRTTKIEKFLRWTTAFFLISSIASAIIGSMTNQEKMITVTIILTIITQISSIILTISLAYEPMKILTNPIKFITEPIKKEIPEDSKCIKIISEFEKSEISYVKFKLHQKSKHVKERCQFITGKIESIGIIPSVISLAIAIHSTPSSDESIIDSTTFLYISLFCTFSYLVTLSIRYTIQRTERMISIIDYAKEI